MHADRGAIESARDSSRALIQPKLRVSAPGDESEREADTVADAVTRIRDADIDREWRPHDFEAIRNAPGSTVAPFHEVARQADQQEEDPGEDQEEDLEEGVEPTEENIREMEEGPLAQRKAERGAATVSEGRDALWQAIDSREAGQTLDPRTRTFMERRFGHDFSQVRVYSNEQAHQAARSVHARAFTVGQDIWFGRGEYAPQTDAGRHLLAHELTHTVQQRGQSNLNLGRIIQRSTCPSSCVAPVAAGNLCRASSVTRDGCASSPAADPANRISHIRVDLGARRVTLFWNGAPRTATGTTEDFECTPNSSRTPRGWDTVGRKCGVDHTSWARFNMAWFTEFASTNMDIGFHDSQPVGTGFHSHGCVRVSCEAAQRINANSESGWTSIIVR